MSRLDGHHGNGQCRFWLGRAKHHGGYSWTSGSGAWGERSRGTVQDVGIGAEAGAQVIRVRSHTGLGAWIRAPTAPRLAGKGHPRGGAENNAGPADGYRPPIGESRSRRRRLVVDWLLGAAALQARALIGCRLQPIGPRALINKGRGSRPLMGWGVEP